MQITYIFQWAKWRLQNWSITVSLSVILSMAYEETAEMAAETLGDGNRITDRVWNDKKDHKMISRIYFHRGRIILIAFGINPWSRYTTAKRNHYCLDVTLTSAQQSDNLIYWNMDVRDINVVDLPLYIVTTKMLAPQAQRRGQILHTQHIMYPQHSSQLAFPNCLL